VWAEVLAAFGDLRRQDTDPTGMRWAYLCMPKISSAQVGAVVAAGVAMFWFRRGFVAGSTPEVCQLRHDDRLCCCDWSTSA